MYVFIYVFMYVFIYLVIVYLKKLSLAQATYRPMNNEYFVL